MFRVLLHKLAAEEETASTRLLTGHQAGGSRCGKLPSHSARGWKPQARYGHGRRVLRALPCGTGGHFLALSSKGGDADRDRERETERARRRLVRKRAGPVSPGPHPRDPLYPQRLPSPNTASPGVRTSVRICAVGTRWTEFPVRESSVTVERSERRRPAHPNLATDDHGTALQDAPRSAHHPVCNVLIWSACPRPVHGVENAAVTCRKGDGRTIERWRRPRKRKKLEEPERLTRSRGSSLGLSVQAFPAAGGLRPLI